MGDQADDNAQLPLFCDDENLTPGEEFYVYLHKRPRDGSVFHAGYGRGKRAWEPIRRTALWKKTALRSGGFDVQIVEGCLTRDQAKASLKKWIGEIEAKGLDDPGSV